MVSGYMPCRDMKLLIKATPRERAGRPDSGLRRRRTDEVGRALRARSARLSATATACGRPPSPGTRKAPSVSVSEGASYEGLSLTSASHRHPTFKRPCPRSGGVLRSGSHPNVPLSHGKKRPCTFHLSDGCPSSRSPLDHLVTLLVQQHQERVVHVFRDPLGHASNSRETRLRTGEHAPREGHSPATCLGV